MYKVTSRFTDDQVKGSFTPRESGGESEKDLRKYDKRQMKFSLLLPAFAQCEWVLGIQIHLNE